MPFVRQRVAFPTVDFEPGFPSLSVYQCNPWASPNTPGAAGCAKGPVTLGRERTPESTESIITRALVEAGNPISPEFSMSLDRGIVPSGLGANGSGHHSCGCGGKCGGSSRSCHDHGGLGDYGLPDFSAVAADPLGYVKGNAFPLLAGLALGMLFFKKR